MAQDESNLVALCNHCFLREENFFWRNFNPEIASRDHDAVRGGNNVIQIFYTLMILDFRNDHDVFSLLAENVADFFHAGRVTDE